MALRWLTVEEERQGKPRFQESMVSYRSGYAQMPGEPWEGEGQYLFLCLADSWLSLGWVCGGFSRDCGFQLMRLVPLVAASTAFHAVVSWPRALPADQSWM